MDEVLPERVQRFIAGRIDSIEKLETLLLLAKDPSRTWSATEISTELRSAVDWSAAILADLQHKGLLTDAQQRYQFAPKESDHVELTSELARCYASARVRVVTFIYSRPQDSVQSFADAFRLRKGKENG